MSAEHDLWHEFMDNTALMNVAVRYEAEHCAHDYQPRRVRDNYLNIEGEKQCRNCGDNRMFLDD